MKRSSIFLCVIMLTSCHSSIVRYYYSGNQYFSVDHYKGEGFFILNDDSLQILPWIYFNQYDTNGQKINQLNRLLKKSSYVLNKDTVFERVFNNGEMVETYYGSITDTIWHTSGLETLKPYSAGTKRYTKFAGKEMLIIGNQSFECLKFEEKLRLPKRVKISSFNVNEVENRKTICLEVTTGIPVRIVDFDKATSQPCTTQIQSSPIDITKWVRKYDGFAVDTALSSVADSILITLSGINKNNVDFLYSQYLAKANRRKESKKRFVKNFREYVCLRTTYFTDVTNDTLVIYPTSNVIRNCPCCPKP